MHVHGRSFELGETDDNMVPEGARLLKHTVDIGPGERYDVIWEAREPGKRCALYEVASTLEPRTRATNP
jgi:FtsP/CotA-like multicopper oxidase with cupredoxin domain